MSVIRRWKLIVCGDCRKAAGDGPHLTCDLNARDREFEVVLACAYDALRDLHAGAVEDRDALRLMLKRLLDVALVDGYGETVRDEAEALLDPPPTPSLQAVVTTKATTRRNPR